MKKLARFVAKPISARDIVVTAAVLLAATLIQYAGWPYISPFAYLIYYPAIIICAFYGDGLLATVSAILLAQYLFIEAPWEFSFGLHEDGPRVFTFAFSGVVLTALINEVKAERNKLVVEQQLRERLISLIAHDLRNPLTSARLGIDRTLHSWPPANQAALLRSLDALTRADHLVANILDASRIAAGEPMPVFKTSTDVKELVGKTVLDAELTYGKRFRFDAPADAVVGQVDPDGVRRVLENLVANAVKYGDPNAPITIRLVAERNSIMLSVANKGEPMSAETLSNIFRPFHRAGRADAGGWGLGLVAVKSIVEAHGGTVRVESTREFGTRFEISLPLSP